MAFDMNPKANTHPNVAKNQHLIPRTYMREWSSGGNDTVFVYKKNEKNRKIKPKNIDKINCEGGFHDIKAGDIFIPDEALESLFGFLKKYRIELDEKELETLRDLSKAYYRYDEWKIYDDENLIANKKLKNLYKKTIEQSRYTFIEEEWGRQFENNWQTYIHQLEEKVRCKLFVNTYVPSEEEMEKLMEQILIFNFRSRKGNIIINGILDDILSNYYFDHEISIKERVHRFNITQYDEIKHAIQIKSYYEYLKNRNGKMKIILEKYLKILGIRICLTDSKFPFLTCDNPSMEIKREDNLYEHIFVATPTMLITTFKSNKNLYIRKYLSHEEVEMYNKYIIKNSNLIITRDNTEKILRLIRDNS